MLKCLLMKAGIIKKPGQPSIKILIIEDSPVDSKIIKQTVEICGYTALVAFDGKTGIALAKKHKPDLIVLDYYLPDQTGGDVLKTLRLTESTSLIRVLMLTVSHESHVIVESFSRDLDQYSFKPVVMDELAEQIQLVLRTPHLKVDMLDK